MRLAWLALLAATCGTPVPAMAQMVSPNLTAGPAGVVHPTSVAFSELASYAGVTICYRDQPYSFVSTSLTAMENAETRAHEAKHREQMARFPSCSAFDTWYQTPRGKLDSEAEAYAAGLCVSVAMGADLVSRRGAVIEALAHNLGGEINRLEIVQTLQRYAACPSP